MNLQKDGRIVVIDDIPKEGLPLVRALSKGGFPVMYFTEEQEEFPETPLSGIRLVFLDIDLGTGVLNEKNLISTVISTFKRIINKDNGPFVVIAWTKHEELVNKINRALRDDGFQSLIMISIGKEECMNKEGIYKVPIISNKLGEKLGELKTFHLFTLWGNLVHEASGKIVTDFSEFYELDGNWNQGMTEIFLKLAKSYAGRQMNASDPEEVIRNALYSFNGAFLDTLESEIRRYEYSPEINISFDSLETGVDPKIVGDINSKLLLVNGTENISLPGNIYENLNIENVNVSNLFNGRLDQYKERKKLLSGIKHIFLEVSPVCDYAQKKWQVSRLLPGVMWPHEFEKKINKKAEYVYKSPLIKSGDKLYYLVFDLRRFTSISFDKIQEITPLFRARQELLVDIQSHLARHINRPGVMFVD